MQEAARNDRALAPGHAEEYRRLRLLWRFWSACAFGVVGVLMLLRGAPWTLVFVWTAMALVQMCRWYLESGRVLGERGKRAITVTIWALRGAVLCLVIAYFMR